MARFPILMACILGVTLSACGAPNNTPTTKTVTVTDNGEQFTYTTTTDFQQQSLSKAALSDLEAQMFDAINAERAKGGVCTDPVTGKRVSNPPADPLQLESRIYQAASSYSQTLVKNNIEGHINHADPANKTPTRRMVNAGYKPLAPLNTSGKALFFEESLAYGYLTPAEVIEAWKSESFNHCMTIYVPLTYGAVAVKDGTASDKYQRYWVLNVSGDMAAN